MKQIRLYRRKSLAERVSTKFAIDESTGCWLWIGNFNAYGYGVIAVGMMVDPSNHRRRVMAHRAMWEASVGPTPVGLTLDHLCRNRACVNPAHLEPVTIGENVLRGEGNSALNARKTHCPYGHAYTEANTKRKASRPNKRECRACARDRDRRRRVRAAA